MAQDALIGLIYLKYGLALLRGEVVIPRRHPILLGSVFALGWWAAVELLNPRLPNTLMGLIGLRTLVLYIPLLIVAESFFTDWAVVRRFMRVMAGSAIVVCGVAAVEYVNGPSWYSGLGSGFSVATWGVAGQSGALVFRVNGTFAAAGHFGTYIAALTFIAIAYLLVAEGPLDRLLASLSLLGLMVALFANSQRTTTVILALGFPLFLLANLRGEQSRRSVALLVLSGVALVVASGVAGPAFLDRVASVTTDPGQVVVKDHLVDPFVNHITEAGRTAGFLGSGTGTATSGARYAGPIWDGSESSISGVLYELGPLGLVLFAFLMCTSLCLAFKAWRQGQGAGRPVALAILLYQVGMVAQMGTYAPLQYTPTIFYFWFLAGLAQAVSRGQRERVLVQLPRQALPISSWAEMPVESGVVP